MDEELKNVIIGVIEEIQSESKRNKKFEQLRPLIDILQEKDNEHAETLVKIFEFLKAIDVVRKNKKYVNKIKNPFDYRNEPIFWSKKSKKFYKRNWKGFGEGYEEIILENQEVDLFTLLAMVLMALDLPATLSTATSYSRWTYLCNDIL